MRDLGWVESPWHVSRVQGMAGACAIDYDTRPFAWPFAGAMMRAFTHDPHRRRRHVDMPKRSAHRSAEHDALRRGAAREPAARLADRDRDRLFDRITVDAAADRRKRDARDAVLHGKPKRLAIAAREPLGLVVAAAAPDRADRVDHEARRQAEARRDPRLAGRAAHAGPHFRQSPARRQQLADRRPGGSPHRRRRRRAGSRWRR